MKRMKFTLALGASLLGLASSTCAQETKSSDEEIEFSADQVTYDSENSIIRAIGRVHLERDGYVLDAGEVTYNEATGEIIASGAVELLTPGGEKIYAPRLSLEDDLKQAFIEDIRLLMTDGGQVRAVSAERNAAKGETELERAVYSPCKICMEGESEKSPLWQIKAVKVVHNKNKKRLYYTDATLELFGVPVLWTPKFSHPDPTVEKASGVLPLNIKTTRNLGFYLGVPYHWVINDSKDLTVTPTVTTKEGLLLEGEYRQHIGSGQFNFGGSITYGHKNLNRIVSSTVNDNSEDIVFTGTGNDIISASPGDVVNGQTIGTDTLTILGSKGWRGHVRSDGQFKHSENWRSTYQLNWASDDTYLRRYDFSETDTLVSEYRLEGFYDRSYIAARTMVFQGLRPEDNAGQTGYALPLIDAEFVPKFKPFGGSLSLRGNSVALLRTSGQDVQRLSISAVWKKRFITNLGLVLDSEIQGRSDVYNITDANRDFTSSSTVVEFTGTFASDQLTEWRNLVKVTNTFSFPLVKYSKNGSHTVEPIVQISVSPERGVLERIVNDDSQAFELTDLNLFSANRSSGYDVWEDGTYLTYGLKWQYEGTDLQTDIMFGQTWRFSDDFAILNPGIGLEEHFSNFVGRTSIKYKDWLDIEHRYRLNETNLSFVRNDIDVTLGSASRNIRVGYLKLARQIRAFSNREDREEIRTRGYYQVNENWSLHGTFIHRLKGALRGGIGGIQEAKGTVEYNLGASYKNECLEIGLTFRKNYTQDRDIQPGTSILFQLRLTNLG